MFKLSEEYLIQAILDKKYGFGKYTFSDAYNKSYQTLIVDNKLTEEEFNELLQQERIKQMRELLGNKTKSYIQRYYPELKQRSDVADKEYWSAWLVSHFPDTYTIDNLYQKFFASAAKIIEATSDLETEVSALKEVTSFADDGEEINYTIALEQLLKVALRQGWVQQCKVEYAIKSKMVNEVTTIEDVQAIELSFPEYLLK
jgi:hypothetical protein